MSSSITRCCKKNIYDTIGYGNASPTLVFGYSCSTCYDASRKDVFCEMCHPDLSIGANQKLVTCPKCSAQARWETTYR